MNLKANYLNKKEQLLKAIKIAKEIAINSKLLIGDRKSNHVKYYNILQDLLENPKKEHQNNKSLKSLESDFFHYWNEAQNEDTNEFWREIQKQGLEFIRKDKLKEILNRNKIKNEDEYNYITDVMIVALQEHKINEAQFALLNKFIGDFENKRSKK